MAEDHLETFTIIKSKLHQTKNMTQNFNRGTKKTIMRIEHDIPNKALDQFKYPSNFNKSENL